MKQTEYWNHNTAYYPWIKQQLKQCDSVLDVGCGNGALIAFLNEGTGSYCGIDVDRKSIGHAVSSYSSRNARFIEGDFIRTADANRYDGIIFAASIHHMDMRKAVRKAKSLLNPGGVLLIVGLAEPSTVYDCLIELLRIVPSWIISKQKKMKSSEELGIAVSYTTPKLNEVRRVIYEELPGAELHQALHFRYLLKWTNEAH